MTQPKVSFTASLCAPWWTHNAFGFTPPGSPYDRLPYRQAVLRYAVVHDFIAFLRHEISGSSPYYMQERIDDQDRWFPIESILWTLDLETLPNQLFPLPRPRFAGDQSPNSWLVALDEEQLYEIRSSSDLVPLGAILTRLLPVSQRPIAQMVALWLLYRVLPVCAQHGGPDSWEGLDTMLSPVNRS